MINRWMRHPLSRFVSFILAISLSAMILLYPNALVLPDGSTNHSWLMLLLTGISIGFIHGVGFSPLTTFWRWLLGPVTAWGIMGPGLVYFLLNLKIHTL